LTTPSTGRDPVRLSDPLRAVFDTNVVVSALLFSGGHVAWLRDGWAGGAIVPVVSRDTLQELVRVLAYPKFRLNRDDRNELLGDYVPYTQLTDVSDQHDTPRCRDPHDQIFVDPAVAARADALVSGDRHLHELGPFLEMPVWSPGELREEWHGRFRG
jgi:putative PIN family toxin of toxin-antitoxin system